MVNKRKLRKLERELTREGGEGLDLTVKTLHQVARGELDPNELSEEAREKLYEIHERAKEADKYE